MVETARQFGGLLFPIAAIGGLLLIWALIVIVCLQFGPAWNAFLGDKMLLH